MKKIQIDRSSWHYRFIHHLVAVDDEKLTNTCMYFWYFVRAVLSVGFFILVGIVVVSFIAFMLIGNIYGVYLLFMGIALPEFVKVAFSILLLFGILAFAIVLPHIISKIFKTAARSAENLAESESSAGQVYKSVKNKTCAYIEFK